MSATKETSKGVTLYEVKHRKKVDVVLVLGALLFKIEL